MQDMRGATELDRMTGIRSALETGDNIIAGSQHVHDLPFTLITPLDSQNHINL